MILYWWFICHGTWEQESGHPRVLDQALPLTPLVTWASPIPLGPEDSHLDKEGIVLYTLQVQQWFLVFYGMGTSENLSLLPTKMHTYPANQIFEFSWSTFSWIRITKFQEWNCWDINVIDVYISKKSPNIFQNDCIICMWICMFYFHTNLHDGYQ